MTSDQEVLRRHRRERASPCRCDVVQRLRLPKLGDYSFAVPGPIVGRRGRARIRIRARLASRRDHLGGLLAPGKKTLAARASLVRRARGVAPAAARDRSRGRRRAGRPRRERDANARARFSSGRVAGTRSGGGARRDAAATSTSAPWRPISSSTCRRRRFRNRSRSPRRSRCRASSRSKRFAYRLGDGGPRRSSVSVPTHRRREAELTVTPVSPVRLLTPPGGAATWTEALRRGRVDPATLLEKVSRRAAHRRPRDSSTQNVPREPGPDGRSNGGRTSTRRRSDTAASTPVEAVASDSGSRWPHVPRRRARRRRRGRARGLWANS